MPEALIIGTGTIMVLFSAFCFGMAVFREISPGPPPPEPDVRRIPSMALVVINGFLVIVAFAALVGIWFGNTGG